jgi:F420-dependent oxidoreductase-like protein
VATLRTAGTRHGHSRLNDAMSPVELVVFTEPQQGASYAQLRDLAQAAEELGFDGFFRSDHYLHTEGGDPGLGPSDAWTTLAGLARDTTRIRLGTLVSSVTYRLPGILAIQVAGVDEMSDGRAELGLGTGWYAREHEAYGIPFPAGRFGLLEEQLQIVTGLWTTPPDRRFSFDGEHYRLVDAPPFPRPVQQPHPPIIIGGGGPRRTPNLAARFASEYNTGFANLATTADRFERVRAACVEVGRAPESIRMSAAHQLACATDEPTLLARAATHGSTPDAMRDSALVGTPDEVIARIRAIADLGVTRVYLQVKDLTDVAHLELVAREVAPALR